MWAKKNPRVSDNDLIIEAVRRQRPRPIPNATTESYVGSDVKKVCESLSLWLTNSDLRDHVNNLILSGAICLCGTRTERNFDTNTSTITKEGLITSIHPNQSFRRMYTLNRDGTHTLGDYWDAPVVLKLQTFYVKEDGVPLKIKNFLNDAIIIYPW